METASPDRLFIANRWLEYEGELRAGLLRVILLISFYSVELYQYLSAASADPGLEQFHRRATYLCAAWLLVSLAALVLLARKCLPSWLKYATSGADIGLLTLVAWFGSAAASPLACLYLLLVMMAGLRGSLKLIWFTTAIALVAYLSLWAWPASKPLAEGVLAASSEAGGPKPIVVMIVGLGILASGLVTGQVRAHVAADRDGSPLATQFSRSCSCR